MRETELDVPGFNPVEVYETAIAHLEPNLDRRAKPTSAEELLAWAGEPLATALSCSSRRRVRQPPASCAA